MSSTFETVAVYALLALTGTGIGALISAMIFGLGRRWLNECPPLVRERLLLALLVCPVIAAVALVLGMSAPGFFFSASQAAQHCAADTGQHFTLCQWHAPQISLPDWLAAGVFAASALVMVTIGIGALRLFRAHRKMQFIRRMARRQPDGHFTLPIQQPMAFAAGLFRGEAVISEGLSRSLTATELDIVLAHERAHIKRRDMLLTVVTNSLARLQLPWIGRALRNAWHLAVEQRCDQQVAQQTGNRLAVADCLLRVSRLRLSGATDPTDAAACHLLDGDLPARINALLHEPTSARMAPILSMGSVEFMALTGLLLSGPQIHHWMEMLLPAAGL